MWGLSNMLETLSCGGAKYEENARVTQDRPEEAFRNMKSVEVNSEWQRCGPRRLVSLSVPRP